MSETENPRVTLGDNLPPAMEIVNEELNQVFAEMEKRRLDLIAAAERNVVGDVDQVARSGDKLTLIDALIDDVTSRAVKVALPYAQANQLAKNRTERWLSDLVSAKARIQRQVADFRTEQRARIVKQQAEQEAEEARLRGAPNMVAAAPAPAAPIALPSVRSDYGATTGDRKITLFAWKDPRKLPDDVLNHPAVQEAIRKACRDIYRIRKTIDGVVITTDMTTTTRKR